MGNEKILLIAEVVLIVFVHNECLEYLKIFPDQLQ